MLSNSYKEKYLAIYQRGLKISTFWNPIIIKTGIFAILGIFSGFILGLLLLNNRDSYKSTTFYQEYIFNQIFSFDYLTDVIFFLPLVFLVGFLLYLVSVILLIKDIQKLKQIYESYSIQSQKKSKLFNLTVFGFISITCVVLIRELIFYQFSHSRNLFVIVFSLGILLVLILSIDRFFYVVIDIIVSHYSKNINVNANSSFERFKKYFYENFLPLSRFLLVILLLYFIYEYFLDTKIISFINSITIIVGLLIIYWLSLFLLPQGSKLRSLQKILHSSYKTSPQLMFSILFIFLLFSLWQSSLYFTMVNSSINDAYYQVGGDIKIGLDPTYVNSFGLDGKNPDRIISLNEQLPLNSKINSILRVIVNSDHFLPPLYQTNIDLIIFNTSQYLQDNFLIQDSWFIGGSAKELLSKVGDNPRSFIILEKNYADLLEKDIGENVTLTNYNQRILRTYNLTIIGLVKYFPPNFFEEKLSLRAFGIVDLELANSEFLERNPEEVEIIRNLNQTTFWMLRTSDFADRDLILQKILSNPRIQFISEERSLTINTVLKDQEFIKELYPYIEITALLKDLSLLMTILLGWLMISEWWIYIRNPEIDVVLIELGQKKSYLDFIHFLNQIFFLEILILLAVFVSQPFTELSVELLLPGIKIPFSYNYPIFQPVILVNSAMILFSIVVFLLTLLKAFDNYVILLSIIELIFIGAIAAFIFINRSFEVLLYNVDIFHYMTLINILISLFLIILGVISLRIFLKLTNMSYTISLLKSGYLKIINIGSAILHLIESIFRSIHINIFFYMLVFKKFIQNKQRILILLTGTIISLSLIAGVSTNIDNTALKVVTTYLKGSDRVSDYVINQHDLPDEQIINFIESRKENEFSWIEDYNIVHRWHAAGMSQQEIPEWVNNSKYYPFVSVSPVISMSEGYFRRYEKNMILEEGIFNISGTNVVISRTYADRFLINASIGTKFSLFDWLRSTKPGFPDMFPESKLTNWSTTLTISGIISDSSPFLFFMIEKSGEIIMIDSLGAILIEENDFTIPSFFDELSYQPVFLGVDFRGDLSAPLQFVFNKIVFVHFKNSAIDWINPADFLNNIDYLTDKIVTYLGSPIDPVTLHYPLKEILHEYTYWTSTVRIGVIILSIPILLIGWYFADFSFKYVYRSRRIEISNLKSRGVDNQQIFLFLIAESIFLSLIASSISLLIGSASVFLQFWLEKGVLPDQFIVHPTTIIFLFVLSFLFIFLGSIRPIQQIINLSVEEMHQTEIEPMNLITREEMITIKKSVRDFFILGFSGVIILIGITSLPEDLISSNLVIIYVLLGLGLVFIGFVKAISILLKFIPDYLETRLKIGKNSPQWFLISREMKCRIKQTSIAFVVLTLTISYGITSLGVINSFNVENERNSYVSNGGDLHLQVKKNYQTIGDNQFDSIRNLLDQDERIETFTQYFMTDAYFLHDQSYPEYPDSVRTLYLNFLWKRFPIVKILFINVSTFFETVYTENIGNSFFVNEPTDKILSRFKTEYEEFLKDPEGKRIPILVDEKTFLEKDLKLDSTLYFTTGKNGIYKGHGKLAGVMRVVPPGISSKETGFIIAPNINLKSSFGIDNPTSGFIVNKKVSYESIDLIHSYKSNYTFWQIDKFSIPMEYLQTTRNSLEFETIQSILNLNFFFSLILILIGYFLVFYIRILDKRKEIGIIKSFGFSDANTILLFMLEAVFIIIISSLLGIVIGLIGGNYLNLLLPSHYVAKLFIIPFDIILILLSLGVFSAIIGSYIPAKLTNRIKISELIR
ncbi:MAG: hypothetical protein HeimC3_50870 [Candidatus Heimdallarchaeota archaeon LC_3]|nr:MAG: hypothetical protein HeimC3_50870 [Candidatus Heimdallarchaeota archaeon LC_3]